MKLAPVYGILDGDVLASRGLDLLTAADALIEGGLRLLQLRWKGTYTREVYATAQEIAARCRNAGALFVVNDRADVALLLGAGVHMGQDDLPAAAARRVTGTAALLGISTHNEAQFREALASDADYLALGPIFGTISKLRPDPIVGVPELARLRTLSQRPLVAIGGITRSNAPEVWKAGADSVAVIGDLYPEAATKASVRQRAEEWIRIANEELIETSR